MAYIGIASAYNAIASQRINIAAHHIGIAAAYNAIALQRINIADQHCTEAGGIEIGTIARRSPAIVHLRP